METIKTDGNWQFFKIKDFNELKNFKKLTPWDPAHNIRYYNSYAKDGKYFVVIKKKDKRFKELQDDELYLALVDTTGKIVGITDKPNKTHVVLDSSDEKIKNYLKTNLNLDSIMVGEEKITENLKMNKTKKMRTLMEGFRRGLTEEYGDTDEQVVVINSFEDFKKVLNSEPKLS